MSYFILLLVSTKNFFEDSSVLDQHELCVGIIEITGAKETNYAKLCLGILQLSN